jgi:hypothetical protein
MKVTQKDALCGIGGVAPELFTVSMLRAIRTGGWTGTAQSMEVLARLMILRVAVLREVTRDTSADTSHIVICVPVL